MRDDPPGQKGDLQLVQLLPNLMTIAAICAGLTAIRFGFQGDFDRSVRLILLACLLDGMDGRVARMLKSESKIGAELDSLADFLNFGVAPALILHVWALQDWRGGGWMAVLVYTICCVLRLARFNVTNKEGDEAADKGFFVGIPSPAGALVVMLPMFVAFLFPEMPQLPAGVLAFYVVAVGLLMISNIPTPSFKKVAFSKRNAKFVIVGFVLLIAALLTYLWATLVVLSVGYMATVAWALRSARLRSPGKDT